MADDARRSPRYRHDMRPLILLGLVALALAACGSSEAADDTAAPESTAATTAPTTDPPATTAETRATETTKTTAADTTVSQTVVPGSELVGRWAHYDVVAYQDDTLKTLIISFGFNDFSEVDGQIIDQGSFCFSEQRTDQPIETSLSDAATQAIKPPPTPVTVDTVDGVLRVQRAATPTPVGIRLDDPANELLPTDPNDPRIVDDDGDGNPGITVSIRVTDDLTGELYIARREIFAYEAFLTDPDTLTGTVTDDSEQLVIGASDPIFASSPANWGQFPDLTKSPIILERVDADWDCERLAAERNTLFPPTPVVDW
jgi:hypothetical protein